MAVLAIKSVGRGPIPKANNNTKEVRMAQAKSKGLGGMVKKIIGPRGILTHDSDGLCDGVENYALTVTNPNELLKGKGK